MTDGNTARALPAAHDELHRRYGAAAAAPAVSVSPGNDKISRAIAEGLMVLPDDDGVPPLLRKKRMNSLLQSRPADRGASVAANLEILGDIQPPQEATWRRAVPEELQQQEPQLQEPEQREPQLQELRLQEPPRQTGAVVTPHPAAFRSQATPLAINPAPEPRPQGLQDFAPRSLPPMPVGGASPAEKLVRVSAPEANSAMEPAAISRECLKPVPPPLHAVKDTIPAAPLGSATFDAPVAVPAVPVAVPAPVPVPVATYPEPEMPAPPQPAPQYAPQAAPAVQPQPAAIYADQPAFQQPQFAQPLYQPPAPQVQAPQHYAQSPAYGYLPPANSVQPQYPPQWQQPVYYPAAPVAHIQPQPYPPAQYPPPPAPAYHRQEEPLQKEAASGAQLLSGLLQYLPPPGKFWSDAERRNWLDAAATLFDIAYGKLDHFSSEPCNTDPCNTDPSSRGHRVSRANHRLRNR